MTATRNSEVLLYNMKQKVKCETKCENKSCNKY